MASGTLTQVGEVPGPHVMGQLTTRETVWAIVKASSGNLVEWFDFYIYAFFSVYFAEQFFTGTGQTGAFKHTLASRHLPRTPGRITCPRRLDDLCQRPHQYEPAQRPR